ncbi:MAG: 3-oxo-tetronate 4-phosphate decarboxylase [Pseudomonadota bacterium]
MKYPGESEARENIVMHGQSLHQRGYVPGSSGNISVRISDGILVSPTNSCLGRLDPARISKIDLDGNHVAGDKPSKEAFLHASMYKERATDGAVVHLHCTHAVAVSCKAKLDPDEPIKPMTPYYVMRIGQLKVLPYFPPGDRELAHAVEAVAARHHAILLANHGPVVAGSDLSAAVYAIEELEEAAKLSLMLEGESVAHLSSENIAELERRFQS